MTALLKGHWTSSINALRKRGRDLVRIIFASFTIGPKETSDPLSRCCGAARRRRHSLRLRNRVIGEFTVCRTLPSFVLLTLLK